MKNFFNIFSDKKETQEKLSDQKRGELLAAIAENPTSEYSTGTALGNYAQKETNAETFRQVVDKVITGKHDTIVIKTLCHAIDHYSDRGVISNYVILAEKILDRIDNFREANYRLGDELGLFARIATYVDQVGDVVRARLPEIIKKIHEPDDAITTVCQLKHKSINDNLLDNKYNQFICGLVVDIARRGTRPLNFDWATGYIGLQQGAKNEGIVNKARHLLLAEVAKASDADRLTAIVAATGNVGHNHRPDREIDEAAADKWKNLTAGLDRDARFKAAANVIGDRYNRVVGEGKLLDAGVATAVAAAKEYAAEKSLPAEVRSVLKKIVEHKIGDFRSAAHILDSIPDQASLKPSVSLNDFLSR